MTDAANNPEILSRLADIELPAPPDWQPLLITGGAIIIALASIVLTRLYIRHIKKIDAQGCASAARGRMPEAAPADIDTHLDPALAARLQLQQLVHDWQSRTISDREAAYRLTTLLRLGLGLPQLTHACPPHIAADQHAWQDTVRLCSNLRYQETSAIRLTPEIFQRAEQWLIKSSQPGQPDGHGV